MRRRAFTLIELLIVVAIIAILAAIAVPNFLEAQTRSKVSRVRNDLRTIATALESYFSDYNKYPNDSDNTVGKNGAGGLALLTSPVAYLSSLPVDPFQLQISSSEAGDADSDFAKNYAMGSGSDNQGWRGRFGNYGPQDGNPPVTQAWLLVSVGVDVNPITGADDTRALDEFPWGSNAQGTRCTTYDPTNGTISDGDIYRAGGQLNQGRYFVNGQLFGRFD